MTRTYAAWHAGSTPVRIFSIAAAALLLAGWSGCCWPRQKACEHCDSGPCPTYCPPQGECFGYYATYWRRWPGDCHLWHPEMLPAVVEPVSATAPAEEMPANSIMPTMPGPEPPMPSDAVVPPPVIVEPKATAPAQPQTMTAPPVELGPDALSRRRIAYPPQGGVIPARYPAADLQRLDAERLSRIGTTLR